MASQPARKGYLLPPVRMGRAKDNQFAAQQYQLKRPKTTTHERSKGLFLCQAKHFGQDIYDIRYIVRRYRFALVLLP